MVKRIMILASVLMLFSFCGRTSPDFITAAGVVDGEVIVVKAAVAGEVEKLNISEGMEIAVNDILAEIDSEKIFNQIRGLDIQEKEIRVNRRKLERNIQFLQSNLMYWKDQVASFERLEEKKSISGDQLEKARLKEKEVEVSLFDAQQSLKSLSIQSENIQNRKEHFRLLLEDHIITSPVSGIVLKKFLSEGETVFPGTSVADILDRASLYVEVFLEGQELSLLELGQKVEILVDGMEGRVFTGTIIYFGQKAEFSPKYIISEMERKSLLYRVKIRLEKDLDVFKLGMPVTVRIRKAGD